MLPYWILFLFFAIGALISLRGRLPARLPAHAHPATGHTIEGAALPSQMGALLPFALLLLFLMIGLRFEVGGDWLNYLSIFERSRIFSLGQQMARGDWGYTLLNYGVSQVGGGFWLVNAIVAIPFVWGFYRLARTQPEPWLMMAVAVPYLIIVVGMGYTRQAAAIGFLMMGIAAIINGAGIVRFTLYILAAALFHKTAIVCLPLMLFVFPQSRLANVLMVVALTASLNTLFLSDSFERLSRNYIEAKYNSSGAAIRIAQLVLSAMIFYIGRKKLGFDAREEPIWRNLSLVSLLMVPVLLLSPSSTVVDRISLYLLPLQIVVLARVPLWLRQAFLGRLLVLVYSGTVLFVWLNYAVNSFGWLPYQTILTESSGR
ncbi:EpsG family protein [Sphingomonas swuensis]|uniref:EpsG family protein n=1 Tax=Sphingomonas swuensis TaxID=977800 RepID=A0ABP7SXR1_9SPHN